MRRVTVFVVGAVSCLVFAACDGVRPAEPDRIVHISVAGDVPGVVTLGPVATAPAPAPAPAELASR